MEVLLIAVGVQRENADTVAPLHAQPGERTGKPGDAIDRLGHRADAIPVDRRRPVRILLQVSVKRLGQIHVCSSERRYS